MSVRGAKVEQIDKLSDSDSEDGSCDVTEKYIISVSPTDQPPTYLLMNSKFELVGN